VGHEGLVPPSVVFGGSVGGVGVVGCVGGVVGCVGGVGGCVGGVGGCVGGVGGCVGGVGGCVGGSVGGVGFWNKNRTIEVAPHSQMVVGNNM